jgi:hypothetical protein
MELVIIAVEDSSHLIPPPKRAIFSVIVELATIADGQSLKLTPPPPPAFAVFPLISQLVIDSDEF